MSLPPPLQASESKCNTAILIRATERESISAKQECMSWESGYTDENGGICLSSVSWVTNQCSFLVSNEVK